MMSVVLFLSMILAGGAIGLLYFGGLWLTLKKLSQKRRWGLWLGASFLARTALAMAFFWLLAAGDWHRLLTLAAGFSMVRFLLLKIQNKPIETS